MKYHVCREILIGLLLYLAVAQANTIDSDDSFIVAEPDKLIEAHQQVDCSDCHQMIASLDAKIPNKERYGSKCLDCHASQPKSISDLSQYFHQDRTRKCNDCHSFHESGLLIAGGNRFVFSGNEITRFQCRTCHNDSGDLQKLTKGHFIARDHYHQDNIKFMNQSPSATCLECHGNERKSKTAEGDVVTAIHLNSSASHPVGVLPSAGLEKVDGDFDFHKLSLYDGKMECQTCHRLNSGTQASLVQFEQEYDLCWGCHNQGKVDNSGQ